MCLAIKFYLKCDFLMFSNRDQSSIWKFIYTPSNFIFPFIYPLVFWFISLKIKKALIKINYIFNVKGYIFSHQVLEKINDYFCCFCQKLLVNIRTHKINFLLPVTLSEYKSVIFQFFPNNICLLVSQSNQIAWQNKLIKN